MTQPPSPPSHDIRDACFDAVYQLVAEDPRVIILSDDQGALSLDRLRRDFPGRFINAGIAEQNLINVAAGLAMGGMRPFVCGITNFISLRCCEQIAVSLCHPRLPVVLLASGGGLTYSSDGPTHHAVQDIAIIRSMPHLRVYQAADATSTAALVRQCHQGQGPAYLRVEKGCLPDMHSTRHDFSLGCARLRDGTDGLILSTGYTIHTALDVARQLQDQGIPVGVMDVYRLKPLNRTELLTAIRDVSWLAIVEEQIPTGGLGTLVCELVAESNLKPRLHRFHLPEVPCYYYGSREWLHQRYSLDATSIARVLKQRIHSAAETEPAYEYLTH